MEFSSALANLKDGSRITRRRWNGPNQYVTLQKGYPEGIPVNANTAEATGLPEGTIAIFRPYMMLCTVEGSFVPWAPSGSDVLATDWEIYETPEQATAEILADPEAMAAIEQGQRELAEGWVGPASEGIMNLRRAEAGLAFILDDWRALNADTEGFDARSQAWKLTISGRRDDASSRDQVVSIQIESLEDYDVDQIQKVMDQIDRLGDEDLVKPGDPRYPVRPQQL